MRNNQPLTNFEYVLKETDSIVPRTGLKGAITYINEDFQGRQQERGMGGVLAGKQIHQM